MSSRDRDEAVQAAFSALESDDADRLVIATRILAEASAEQQPASPTRDAVDEPIVAPMAAPKVFWWATATQHEVEVAMRRLSYFVEWLVEVYDLSRSVLPACWPLHPDLVQELWALMCLHFATHAPEQHGGPIAFASNLAHARTRLSEMRAGARCVDGHQPRDPDEKSRAARRSGYAGSTQPFTWTWPVSEPDEEQR